MPVSAFFDVVVGVLNELQQDVLDVFADVAGLGQRGGVCDGERNVEHPGQRLGHERLAAPCRPDQQDVRFGQLDVVIAAGFVLHTLVVVVHGDRQDLLGVLLADDVVVQEGEDLSWLGELVEVEVGRLGQFLFDDFVAEVDALIADIDTRTGDELLDLLLRLAAERAFQQLAAVTELRHVACLAVLVSVLDPEPHAARIGPSSATSRLLMTSSMMPYSSASSADITKSRSVSLWIFSSS